MRSKCQTCRGSGSVHFAGSRWEKPYSEACEDCADQWCNLIVHDDQPRHLVSDNCRRARRTRKAA